APPSPFCHREACGLQAEAIPQRRSRPLLRLEIASLRESTTEFLFSWDPRGSVLKYSPSSRSLTEIYSIRVTRRPIVIARPVVFRPKRSRNGDQGIYCGWEL